MNLLELTSLILAAVGIGLGSFALWQIFSFRNFKETFFSGKNGAQLEDVIVNQNKKINDLIKHVKRTDLEIEEIQDHLSFAVQKIGVLRYNPFADNGGNQSFSIAILDAHDNGFVITSMHGRESNRVYAKPIIGGKSDFPLTEEELTAIKTSKSLKSLNN